MPTPSVTFWADWVSAEILACKPSAIDKPAGSSAPELILEPEDNWNRVFCKFIFVVANWFCASKEGILFKMLSDIRSLLSLWVSVLGRRTGGLRGSSGSSCQRTEPFFQSNDPYRHCS